MQNEGLGRHNDKMCAKSMNKTTTKVPILKEVNFGKMQLCQVEHIFNIFVLTFGVIAIVFGNQAQK